MKVPLMSDSYSWLEVIHLVGMLYVCKRLSSANHEYCQTLTKQNPFLPSLVCAPNSKSSYYPPSAAPLTWTQLLNLIPDYSSTMAINSGLESLHPELQVMVMLQIPEINTLYSLIRASPRFFQVFSSNKERIISALAVVQFHPDAFIDALDAIRASQIENVLSREPILQYLDAFMTDESFKTPILPLSTALPLCEMGVHISYFINDFKLRAIPILAQVGKPQSISQEQILYSSLSVKEAERLERAFCRFETFRHLFSGEKYNQTPFTALEQAHLFLEEFNRWEIEEIACVRDYLIRRLNGIFDLVEDEFVEMNVGATVGLADREHWEDMFVPRQINWFSTSAKHYHHWYMEYILARGLPFLRQVFQSTGQERMQLVTSNNVYNTEFLTKALRQPSKDTEYDRDVRKAWGSVAGKVPPEAVRDDLDTFNLGWVWSHEDRLPPRHAAPWQKGLRDWGYVFWDRRRLEASGVIGQK